MVWSIFAVDPAANRADALGVYLPAERIPGLDAIRGLAILLVTVYRFNGGAAEEYANPAFRLATLGFRGVDLFFVLSGFLITGILLDAKRQPGYFQNFYARRALRIFPLYFGVLVAAFLVLPIVSPRAGAMFAEARDHQAWLWLYGTNILQAKSGGWPFGYFDHFWSLAVEEHFYLVWPLVIYFANHRATIAACVTVIVLAPAARVMWLMMGGNDVAPEVFTLFRADSLAMGALAAVLMKQQSAAAWLVPVSRHGLWLLALVLILLKLSGRRWLTLPDTVFAALFACLIVVVMTARTESFAGRFWNSSWLQFFGKYSYAMYVFQFPLIPILAPILSVEILAGYVGNASLARIAYIVLMTAITTTLAVASWHLYEKHFLAFKRFFPSHVNRTQ